MIRLLIFAIPVVFILLFINEYLKQRRHAKENWDNQWEEKKKNYQQEKELMKKDREIRKLKQELEDRQRDAARNEDPPGGFSSN